MTPLTKYGELAPIQPIVSSLEPIVLVGGGELLPDDFEAVRPHANRFVAADSGAAAVLAQGHQPEAVIGDFDSLDDTTRADLPAERLHHIAEQDSTDFDKCLRNVAAPLILGLGFLGARVDHQLSVFNRLAARPDKRCVLLGRDDVLCLAPPKLRLDLEAGTRVSLFPMARVSGRSTGLRWPIDGLNFSPDGRVGTSNEATGPVRLETDAPGLLLILPRDALIPLLRAVQSAACGTWSARA